MRRTISTNCGGASGAPSITQQPASLVVTQGTTATFSVAATGAPPLTYQWRFGGNNLSAATASSYTINSAQSSNAGNYDVVVSNGSGAVTSLVATLTVRLVIAASTGGVLVLRLGISAYKIPRPLELM